MTNQEIAKENILRVARKLGHLRERAVFLGGSVTALLITDPAAPDVRPTKDVDVVVQTVSYSEQTRLEEELRSLDFQHCLDPGAPACRWVIGDCLVDVIPVGAGMNAYNDRWSPSAIEHAERLELEAGIWIRHVTAPYFVAIKLEAFADRGEGNYLDSNDIDDIIQVIDGRPELMSEIQASVPDLSTFIAEEFRALLKNTRFLESIPAHLLPDSASQAREPLIIERMNRIMSQ
jgi:predicted nucleotidyltransferase